LEQHDWIVQLNLQAHHNAAARSDEFVMEALVSHGKVDVLIHSLLVAEVRGALLQQMLGAPAAWKGITGSPAQYCTFGATTPCSTP
jgi:hypothetical protein